MSRRTDLKNTVVASDMLSLTTPEDFGWPDPTASAPAFSLAAPLVLPSYVRPPLDHDGILVTDSTTLRHTSMAMPHACMPEGDLITCASLETDPRCPLKIWPLECDRTP